LGVQGRSKEEAIAIGTFASPWESAIPRKPLHPLTLEKGRRKTAAMMTLSEESPYS